MSSYEPVDAEGTVKVIEDFRIAKRKRDRNNHDFVAYVANMFKKCLQSEEEKIAEYEYHKKLYDMEEAIDFFGQAKTAEDFKKLFRSMLLSKATNSRSALVTDARPKITFNPIFKENAIAKFTQELQDGAFPEWVSEAVQAAASPEAFFDYLIDSYFKDWWQYSKLRKTMYTGNKDAILASKSWFEVYRTDKEVFVKNVPFVNVMEDTSTVYLDHRKEVFVTTVLSTRDIERKFKLKKGSLKGEPKYSEKLPNFRARDNVEKWNEKYSLPKARLVVGYFVDNTTVEWKSEPEVVLNDSGETMYDGDGQPIMTEGSENTVELFPSGRVITFVCGQDDEPSEKVNRGNGDQGILIVKDEANRYSKFPVFDYIPEPETEVSGKPIARDLANNQMLADRSMQQAVLNFETVGNAKIFYKPNSITDMAKVSNSVAIKIPISEPRDVKYEPGVPTIAEGTALYSMFVSISRDLSGVHESAEGKRMPNIESGKAIGELVESVNRIMRPSVRFFEEMLVELFTVWAEMFLEIANTGMEFKLGETTLEIKTLPFNMGDYVDSFVIAIVEDSTIPKDELTKLNQAIMLAGMTFEDGMPGMDRRSLMEIMGIDNYEQIQTRLMEGMQIKEQMEQMQQVIQQQGEQMNQMNGVMQEVMAENDTYKDDINKELVKSQSDLIRTEMNNETSVQREVMQQVGKERQIVLKAQVEKKNLGSKENPSA